MNRQDTKYIIATADLPVLLEKLQVTHKILEIKGHRSFHYNNLYLDTKDLTCFKEHHRGRMHRYKIRMRQYVETADVFFEIKRKTNKDRTVKRRFNLNTVEGPPLNRVKSFLLEHSPFNFENLIERVHINFERITMVSFEQQHRLTIDRNLSYYFPGEEPEHLENLCIIEVKQGRASGRMPLWYTLKESGAKPISMSKYCLANMLLDPSIKANRFKPKLTSINRIRYADTA